MSFNKSSLEYYLVRFNIKSLEEISSNQLKSVFLSVINFFKQGEISLDDLSNIASSIWPVPLDTDSKEDGELKNAIHSCAEINFYIRRIPEIDEKAGATVAYLIQTFQYYENHKELIN